MAFNILYLYRLNTELNFTRSAFFQFRTVLRNFKEKEKSKILVSLIANTFAYLREKFILTPCL